MTRFETTIPNKEALFGLFETTGWNMGFQVSADEYHQAVTDSWWRVAAYDAEDKLVGFGRLISDGRLQALIVDMIVRPENQGQGIGKEILRQLVQKAQQHQIKSIKLFCAKGKSEFYVKSGFRERDPEGPGMELIW